MAESCSGWPWTSLSPAVRRRTTPLVFRPLRTSSTTNMSRPCIRSSSAPQFGTESLALDDTTAISRLYPAAGYFATTASVAGSIFAPNGTTRLSGINVIARNVANPFLDAVSALSGDFTDEIDPAVSAVVGTYRFTGLTPGAQYAVYVDEILDGGFSTTPRTLPGPEEFASGATESNSDTTGTFAPVVVAAGATAHRRQRHLQRAAAGRTAAGGRRWFRRAVPALSRSISVGSVSRRCSSMPTAASLSAATAPRSRSRRLPT